MWFAFGLRSVSQTELQAPIHFDNSEEYGPSSMRIEFDIEQNKWDFLLAPLPSAPLRTTTLGLPFSIVYMSICRVLSVMPAFPECG